MVRPSKERPAAVLLGGWRTDPSFLFFAKKFLARDYRPFGGHSIPANEMWVP
jgi:hypothetical protein